MKFRIKCRDLFWFVLVLLPLSICLAYSSLYGIYSEYKLSKIGLSTKAIVTDWQINPNSRYSFGDDRYSLKYQFNPAGSPVSFSSTDFLPGRKNLWASIPYEEWQKSRSSGTIGVVYDPTNPWLNRPLHSPRARVDLATVVIFSLLFLVFMFIGFFKSIRYWNTYMPSG